MCSNLGKKVSKRYISIQFIMNFPVHISISLMVLLKWAFKAGNTRYPGQKTMEKLYMEVGMDDESCSPGIKVLAESLKFSVQLVY